MASFAPRILLRLAFVGMANAAIACGGSDVPLESGEDHPAEPAAVPFEPPTDDVPEGHRVESITADPLRGPGVPPLSKDTCQPQCLPVSWLADVLRSAGLSVWEDPDWRTRGHGSFHDLWGVVAHHTGVERDTEWMVVRDGRSDLKGPLSQLVLEKNGLFRVVASGVAWHAGPGSYPGLDDNDANWHTLGIEAVNTGLESWSVAQYGAYVRGVAAILRYLALDSTHVIGHKEWAGVSQGKWDPGGIDMNVFRADVQAHLDK